MQWKKSAESLEQGSLLLLKFNWDDVALCMERTKLLMLFLMNESHWRIPAFQVNFYPGHSFFISITEQGLVTIAFIPMSFHCHATSVTSEKSPTPMDVGKVEPCCKFHD
jgi:hypothetical protein